MVQIDTHIHWNRALSPPLDMKAAKMAAKTAAKKARRAERRVLAAAPDDRAAAVAAAATAAVTARAAVAALAEATAEATAAAATEAQPPDTDADTVALTFSCLDDGVDVAQGLTLHPEAISAELEAELIAWVRQECERGRSGELRKPTYLRAEGARSQGNRREAIMCVAGRWDRAFGAGVGRSLHYIHASYILRLYLAGQRCLCWR
jgi:hypothetical protein